MKNTYIARQAILNTNMETIGYELFFRDSPENKFPEIDQGRSFPPKYDRRHDLSLTATYRLTNWSWTANFVYATGKAYTPAAARYTLRDPASGRPVNRFLAARRNTGRMLPYQRFDLGMRSHAKFFGGDAEFYLQIFNFYNRGLMDPRFIFFSFI